MKHWILALVSVTLVACSADPDSTYDEEVATATSELVACDCRSGDPEIDTGAKGSGQSGSICEIWKKCVPVTQCDTYKGAIVPPDPALAGLLGQWTEYKKNCVQASDSGVGVAVH